MVALLLLVTLLFPTTAPLEAQGNGSLPRPTGGPRAPDWAKPGVSASRAGQVKVMIEMTDDPAIVAATPRVGPRPGQVSASAFASQAARVESAQRSTLQALQSSGVRTQVLYRVQKAYNGVASVVDAADIDRIKAQPGVKGVHLLRPMKHSNAYTVPLIDAPIAWTTSSGFTGAGLRIGIIDTGVDYKHANFGGTVGSTFPTAVVVGGKDFAGDTYDADSNNPAIFTPNPDNDPMDCNGHGSHVAGSAAGRGVKMDSTTYTGPYDNVVDLSTLKIGPGVAPEASIYALKVFGCSGTTHLTTQAIDWALDPDGNPSTDDHLDVINMSLGVDFGDPDDPVAAAANNAALAGMIVVASAGNAGDATTVVGSPASATRVIAVAASDDTQNRLDGIEATGSISATLPAGTSNEFDWRHMSTVTAPVQYAGATTSGCSAFASDLTNKIIMIEWVPSGESESPCGSATRTANAFAAHASGVILIYNQAYLDISIAGTSDIPAVIVNSTDGATLKNNISGLAVSMKASLLRTELVTNTDREDQVASFTSRGPAGRTGALKPDLTAPGVSIFSTEALSGTEGVSMDGTSMASPHVAGLMTLLKQQHPTWTVEELKALAMNTARHDVFSEVNFGPPKVETSRVGAGRIDAGVAVTSSLVAYETDEPGQVSVSFGAVDALGTTSLTRTVKVVNKSGSPINIDVSYAAISSVTGASISFPSGTHFTVPGNNSVTFPVQLSMNAAQLKNPRDPSMAEFQVESPRQYLAEVTGLIVVNPDSGPDLRVPLYAAVRPASSMHANQATLTATGSTQSLSLGLTGTGVSNGTAAYTDVRSLVSAFELQAISPVMPGSASPDQKAADLRYVGVATDGGVLSSLSGAALFFGLATELNWLRPTTEVEFSILIDVNRDGTADYEIYNTDFVDGDGDPTDVMVTAIYNIATQSTTPGYYLNGFDSTLPTAIFDNNVLVLATPISRLGGLTNANSRFNYKVNVYHHGIIQDSTGVLTFDALRPGADIMTAPFESPTFLDLPGVGIPVRYDQASYQANGSLGVLLLHHYNQDGQRAEAITIQQTQTVSFATGLPTTKTLGDAPFTVSAASSAGLPVTIASQTPAVCTINGSNLVTLVGTGTCALRASQAGNGTVQPASADLAITVSAPATPPTMTPTATPVPTTCAPRPNVTVSVSRLGPGQLQVNVAAGAGALSSIRFGTDTRAIQNGTVQIDAGNGPQQITEPTTVALPGGGTVKSFTVSRNAANQAMLVPMIVTDGCGPWETFVGLGVGE